MEIYEMTYEGILFKIKAEEEKKVFQKVISKKDQAILLTPFQYSSCDIKAN